MPVKLLSYEPCGGWLLTARKALPSFVMVADGLLSALCSMVAVPPSVLGDQAGMTYASTDAALRHWDRRFPTT